MNWLNSIPEDLINFLLVVLFSFLIGLEQRRRQLAKEERGLLFGSDRTFTLIGIWGYILFLLDKEQSIPYYGGGLVLALLLGIFYFQRIQQQSKMGLTTILLALITYTLTPLVYLQPHWLVLLIIVVLLILTEIKEELIAFSRRIEDDEFITLAKFIVISGVILPLLPDKDIIQGVHLSPYRLWLAVVVVSGISYLSYLLKKYTFPKSGIVLTGILGGMYSSTATTLILARKSKSQSGSCNRYAGAILMATGMMYLRILLLAYLLNPPVGTRLAPWFLLLFALSMSGGWLIIRKKESASPAAREVEKSLKLDRNPLEFKVAIIFALLFVGFALLTDYVLNQFGGLGLNVLSYVVGVTDIDPFILSLFQGKFAISTGMIALATLQATTSNNLLKMIYGNVLGSREIRKFLYAGFLILIAVSILFAFLL